MGGRKWFGGRRWVSVLGIGWRATLPLLVVFWWTMHYVDASSPGQAGICQFSTEQTVLVDAFALSLYPRASGTLRRGFRRFVSDWVKYDRA